MKHSSRPVWKKEVLSTSVFLLIFAIIRIFLLSQREDPSVGNNTLAVLFVTIYVCIGAMIYFVEGKLRAWISLTMNGTLLFFLGYLFWDLTTEEKNIFISGLILYLAILSAGAAKLILFCNRKDKVPYKEKVEMFEFLPRGILTKVIVLFVGFMFIQYILVPLFS